MAPWSRAQKDAGGTLPMLGRGFCHKLGYQCQAPGDISPDCICTPLRRGRALARIVPAPAGGQAYTCRWFTYEVKTIRKHSIDYRNGHAPRPPGILQSTWTAP